MDNRILEAISLAKIDPDLLNPEQVNLLKELNLLIKKGSRYMLKLACHHSLTMEKVAKLLTKGQEIHLDDGKHRVVCEDDEYAILAPVKGSRTDFSKLVAYSNADEHADQIKVIKSDHVTKSGKIPALEVALSDPVERKVATMMATSHEYKSKPNVAGALALVKNYEWSEQKMNPRKLQGLDKETRKYAVRDIRQNIRKGEIMPPLIVVDQLHGINPQNKGKVILLDGHHRHQAQLAEGLADVDVYYGKYTGNAQKSEVELRTTRG